MMLFVMKTRCDQLRRGIDMRMIDHQARGRGGSEGCDEG